MERRRKGKKGGRKRLSKIEGGWQVDMQARMFAYSVVMEI